MKLTLMLGLGFEIERPKRRLRLRSGGRGGGGDDEETGGRGGGGIGVRRKATRALATTNAKRNERLETFFIHSVAPNFRSLSFSLSLIF